MHITKTLVMKPGFPKEQEGARVLTNDRFVAETILEINGTVWSSTGYVAENYYTDPETDLPENSVRALQFREVQGKFHVTALNYTNSGATRNAIGTMSIPCDNSLPVVEAFIIGTGPSMTAFRYDLHNSANSRKHSPADAVKWMIIVKNDEAYRIQDSLEIPKHVLQFAEINAKLEEGRKDFWLLSEKEDGYFTAYYCPALKKDDGFYGIAMLPVYSWKKESKFVDQKPSILLQIEDASTDEHLAVIISKTVHPHDTPAMNSANQIEIRISNEEAQGKEIAKRLAGM